MAKHARLSPSSADRWTTCTASPAAQDGIPNTNSDASRMGTVCHQIAEECLLGVDVEPMDYFGRKFVFYYLAETEQHHTEWADDISDMVWNLIGTPEAVVPVTEEMVDAVERGVAFVRERHALVGGKLFVEQRVPIGQFTDEDDAEGSADVILVGDDWLEILDYKFGFKIVFASKIVRKAGIDFITGEPTPELRLPNLQMACYALGSVHKHDIFGEIKTVTMTIIQPFIDNTDSYTCSIDDLQKVEQFLAEKAEETRANPVFVPDYDACFFCRARGNCKAQTEKALRAVFEGVDEGCLLQLRPIDRMTLGTQFALAGFVGKWAKDIEEAVKNALSAGESVWRGDGVHYKLIEGRMGHRKWSDPVFVESQLREAALTEDLIFVHELRSPAQIEALTKAKRGDNKRPPLLTKPQWSALAEHVRQEVGQPRIALETDPRPAITKADGFEEVPTPGQQANNLKD